MEVFLVSISCSGPKLRGEKICHTCPCRGGIEQCRWVQPDHNNVTIQSLSNDVLYVVIGPGDQTNYDHSGVQEVILQDCKILLWVSSMGKEPVPNGLHQVHGNKYVITNKGIQNVTDENDYKKIFVFEPYLNMSDSPNGKKSSGDSYDQLEMSYPNVWM